MKNTLILASVLVAEVLAGALACSGNTPPPPVPINCERGTHQEGNKCVINGSLPAKAAAPGAAAK
jgi:hypothetical protein